MFQELLAKAKQNQENEQQQRGGVQRLQPNPTTTEPDSVEQLIGGPTISFLGVGPQSNTKVFQQRQGQSQSNLNNLGSQGFSGLIPNDPLRGGGSKQSQSTVKRPGVQQQQTQRGPNGRFIGKASHGNQVAPVTKKITKQSKQAQNSAESRVAKVTQINGIDELPADLSKHKRYRIQFHYVDRDGRRHTASVRFGNRNQEDFVDTQSSTTQIKRLSRLISNEKSKNPLSHHHWQTWILNSHKTIPEAVANYRMVHNIL